MKTTSQQARTTRSWKPIEKNLRTLHFRGLEASHVDDLDALLAVARALSGKPTDAEKIEEMLAQAIDGYAQPRRDVARLWFGLPVDGAPDTRPMKSTERHKIAWTRWGEGKESSFRTHWAERTYEFLAKRLLELSQQAAVDEQSPQQANDSKQPEAIHAHDPTSEAATILPSEQASPAHGPTPVGAILDALRNSRPAKMRLLIGGLIVFALVSFGVVDLVLHSTAHGAPSTPPPGSIINTWTGRTSRHMPTAKYPELGKVGMAGGHIVAACDLSAHVPCLYREEGPPVAARLGDIIEVRTLLYNDVAMPIPYVKVFADWSAGKHPEDELDIEMIIQWPETDNAPNLASHIILGSPPDVQPLVIRLPTAGAYHLEYVPKSTRLGAPYEPKLVYRLPDGIMDGGIGLEDLGSPSSCFECGSKYMREVSFQVRVT